MRTFRYWFILTALLGLALGCSHAQVAGDSKIQDTTVSVARKMPVDQQAIDELQLQTNADYHFALGDAFSLEGQSEKAIEEFKSALAYDNKSSTIHLRLAGEYLRKGRQLEALEHAEQSVEYDPKSVQALVLAGLLNASLRAFDKALGHYQKVLEIEPTHREARLVIAGIWAEQGKTEEAVHYLEKLVGELDAKDAYFIWYNIGRIHRGQKAAKSQRRAEVAFRESIRLKPQFADAVVQLAEMQLEQNSRGAAIKLLKQFQAQHGPNVTAAETLGRVSLEDEDYTTALEQFEIIEAADPENLNIKVKMALIHIEQQHLPQAATKLQQVLEASPESDKIRFYLAAVLEEMKKFDAAIIEFRKIPSASTFYNEAIIHAAYLHKVQRRVDLAISTMEEALKVRDDVPQFYLLFASFLDDSKQYERAAILLNKGLEKSPQNPQMHFFLGSIYEKLRDRSKLIEQMELVLKLDNDHAHALNYLAYTFAENNERLDEAERHAQRALELKPDDGFILDTYGWVLFKRGEMNKATQILERAIKLQPKEAIIAEHLGDLYFRMQLAEKARRMYRLALEHESDASVQKKLRDKLAAVDHQVDTISSDNKLEHTRGERQKIVDVETKPVDKRTPASTACSGRESSPDCL